MEKGIREEMIKVYQYWTEIEDDGEFWDWQGQEWWAHITLVEEA